MSSVLTCVFLGMLDVSIILVGICMGAEKSIQ